MFKYILKRLFITIFVLLGVSIIIYTLVRMMPNDYIDLKYAEQLQSGSVSQEQVNSFKDLYGIGDKSFKGIANGYLKWLGNALQGNLGHSFKYNKPVSTVITDNMWVSFVIALIATILQFIIAIPLGVSAATHQYSAWDYMVTVFTMIGISLPTYFFAAIMVKVFSVDFGWFPANGLLYASKHYPATFFGNLEKLGDVAAHLILPILVTVTLSIGGLMRHTRTNTLEVLGSDYIRTARAKGLSEKTVIYKHAFRNTMIPLVTMLAGILPSLFGGMMITEQVFGIDGIGRLAYQALKEGDVPFVMGYNMFLAVLTVIGTLFSDIMYSVVDPRVKLGR
jgi:peptide/nickel transport system permease protein